MWSLIISAEIQKYPVSQTMKATSVSQSQHTDIRGFLPRSRDLSPLHVWQYRNCDSWFTVYIDSVYLLERDIVCESVSAG